MERLTNFASYDKDNLLVLKIVWISTQSQKKGLEVLKTSEQKLLKENCKKDKVSYDNLGRDLEIVQV